MQAALSLLARVQRLRALKTKRAKERKRSTRPTREETANAQADAGEQERQLAREAAKAKLDAGYTAPIFAEYYDDPVGFAEKVLRLRLWKKQKKILRKIAAGDRVAVRSGHKVGKSTTAVIAALWWACTRPRGRVLLTANTASQVNDVLWKELRRIVLLRVDADGKRIALEDVLGAEPAKKPETGMQWGDGREIIGRTADKVESLAGFSGEVLIIADEASGIADEVFEVLKGNLAAAGRLMMFSNPTQPAGEFYDAFHDKADLWDTEHISSLETPNATGDEEAIPGLATAEYCAKSLADYGENDARYQVRVLGNFPSGGDQVVISRRVVDDGKKRWSIIEEQRAAGAVVLIPGALSFGVDVARFGDDESVIAPVRGDYAYELEATNGRDSFEVGALVLAAVKRLRVGAEKVLINVDESGGYGTGVIDYLRSIINAPQSEYRNVYVQGINASASPTSTDYVNARAEMLFGLGKWIAAGGAIPARDKKLDTELVVPRYKFDPKAHLLVEKKDEIKKRIKRSPDRCDALALAVYNPGSFGTAWAALTTEKPKSNFRLGSGRGF